MVKEDRRKSQRVKTNMPVEINHEKGVVVDISRGGLGISPEIIPIGEIIDVKLHVAEQVLNLQGKIKRITFKKTQEGACHIGFSITKAPEAYHKLVDSLQQGREEVDFQD